MATFGFDLPGLTSGRLLSWLRARRKALAGRPATLRWSLVALAVGGLSLVGYLAASALTPTDRTYLGSGRRYSSDDVLKIGRTLDKLRIPYQVDDRRVEVAASTLEAAAAAVAKLDLGPRTLDEIRDDAGKSSWLGESPHEKEQCEQRDQARLFESLINELPGVDGSVVLINRPKPRYELRPTVKPTAFVRLETEGGRELPFSVVESISSILTVNVSGLSPDKITIMDRSGRTYLDAGNPALNALSTNRAREEELSRQILKKLDWITGVRVDVQLATVEAVEQPEPKSVETKPSPAAPAPGISVGVINRPLAIDPDPTAASPSTPPPAAPKTHGRVFVNVPRSYYYNACIVPGRNEPAQEDLQALMVRTATHIRQAVELVIPESRSADWDPPTINVIQDELPIGRSPSMGSGSESRRLANDWAAAGAAGAAAAALVAVGTWIFGSRQPARRSESSRGSLRYHRGSSATPPPTERVLEFVRRNPEAAFSVLNRWTNQGSGRS
jgi:flagellar M-ring protein FliF